jgi:very-short-patch-repair endonuclease
VIRLRGLIPHADERAESPMESRMRWRFIDGGLPAPELQIRVGDGGRQRYLDTGWREQRVAAEFDGLEAHMTAQQLQDDRQRHNWLTDRGWRLLHFTGVEVYRRPAEMIATTATALGLQVPRYPRSWSCGGDTPQRDGVSPRELHDRGGGAAQMPVERHSRERRAVT